ncbi:hypothetical protein BH10CYA1_BH10CYA1_34330 [soil metagenome]
MTNEPWHLQNIGSVEMIELPSSWLEAPTGEPFGGRILRKFYPPENPEVKFCHYERQIPLSTPASKAFSATLYAEFHELSDDEISALSEVLEGMSNRQNFQVRKAYTCYLNSRRVIRVEGRWSTANTETIACFLDVNGRAEQVEQIYFTCPEDIFADLRDQVVKEIFLSVVWKR